MSTSTSRFVSLALFVTLIVPAFAAVTAPAAPTPTGLWWERFGFDADGDKVDDRLEKLIAAAAADGQPGRLLPAYVDFPRIPTSQDVALVAAHGGVDAKGLKHLELVTALLPADRIHELARESSVGMIEWDEPLQASLGTSTSAIKAKPSIAYSPATAWERGYRGEGMVVAIMDTGIRDSHVHFTGLSSGAPKWIAGADMVGPDTFCVNPPDEDGHGTHVASTAVGNGGNNVYPYGRHSGVAPEAQLVEIRIAQIQTAEAGAIVGGIDWVIDWNARIDAGIAPCPGIGLSQRIDVLSLSFGSRGNGGSGNTANAAAVNKATAKGIAFTISAGNCGPGSLECTGFNGDTKTIGSPAVADGAITVANSDDAGTIGRPDDVIAPSSSRGPRDTDGDADSFDEFKPEIAAPGSSITAASHESDTGLVSLTGTSMAAPHVAGVAAILLQANPACAPYERAPVTGTALWNNKIEHPLRDAMIKSAESRTGGVLQDTGKYGRPWDNGWGYGLVDLDAALDEVLTGTSCDLPGAPLKASAGGEYQGSVGQAILLGGSAKGGTAPYSYSWTVDPGCSLVDATTATPSATCGAFGFYKATVTVTDSAAASHSDTATLVIGSHSVPISDDFESGAAGWTVENGAEVASWHLVERNAASPTHAWYDSLDGAETYPTGQDTTLVSPAVDLTAATGGKLRYSVQGAREEGFDYMIISYRVGSGAWQELDRVSGAFADHTPRFADITAATGAIVQFGFRSTSDEFVEETGYYLDDISVEIFAGPSDGTPPSAVTGLSVADVGDGTTLHLTWDAATDNHAVAGYRVYRSTATGTVATKTLITTVSATSLMDTGRITGTTYFYQVVAVDPTGNAGAASGEASGTPILQPDIEAPTAPSGLSVDSMGRTDWLRVVWLPASDNRGVQQYEVERDDGAGFAARGTTANVYWADGGLVSGHTYGYRVRAIDTSGNFGPWSAVGSGAPALGEVDWTHFKQSSERDGATHVAGDITTPGLLQQMSLGGAIRASPLAADLDGDGDLEIVAVTDMIEASGRVVVTAFEKVPGANPPFAQMWRYVAPPSDNYLGNSATSFHPNEGYGTAAIGDLTGDGLPEVVIYYNYLQRAQVSLNDGHLHVLDGATGAFLSEVPNSDIIIAEQVHPAIGDVTGDGLADLVVVRTTGGTAAGRYIAGYSYEPTEMLAIFNQRLDGGGSFAAPVLVEADGRHLGLEVAVGNDNAGVGRLWLCSPAWGDAGCGAGIAMPTGVRGIAAADLDRDGAVELVVGGRTGSSLAVVTTANGGLSMTSISASPIWNTPVIVDVDGDGLLDIVNVENSGFANDAARAGTVRIHGYSAGALTSKGTLTGDPRSSPAGGASAADVNGDGHVDVVFGGVDGGVRAVRVGGGTLAPTWNFATNIEIRSPVALADLDGDGGVEIVVGDELGRLSVLDTPNLPPVIEHIDDQQVREGGTATFRAEAADPEGANVQFSMPDKPAAATFTDNGDGTADFSWTTTHSDAGTHTVTVVASDGVASSSKEVEILVSDENFPPTVSFTMSPTSGVTKETRVTATETSSDADGTVVSRAWQVTLIEDSTPDGVADTPGAVVASGSGSSFSFFPPDDGRYEVRVTVTDNLGATAFAARELVVNNIAPVLIASAPAYARPGVAATFVDYSIDRDGSIARRSWDMNNDGVFELANAPANAQYAFPTAGTFTARLEIEDTDGGMATKTYTVIVDGTPPVTTATYPSAPASGFYGGPVDIRFSRSDSGGSGMQSTSVKVNGVGTPRGGSADFTFRVAGEGTHVVEYFSQDRAGNVEAARSFTIRIDTAAPFVKIIEPAAVLLPAGPALHGGVFLAGETINIRAGASDAGSGIARVDFYVGAEFLGSDSTAADGYRASWDTSGRNTGSYELRAYAFDNAGRSAFSAEAVMLVATPPEQTHAVEAGLAYSASNDCSTHAPVACQAGDALGVSADSDGNVNPGASPNPWAPSQSAGAAVGYLVDGAQGGDVVVATNAGANGRGCDVAVSAASGPGADCSSVVAGSASVSVTGANDCDVHLPVACTAGETVAFAFGDGVMVTDGVNDVWAPGQALGAWAGFLSDGGQGGHGPVAVAGEANGMSCSVQTWGGPVNAAVPRFDCALA